MLPLPAPSDLNLALERRGVFKASHTPSVEEEREANRQKPVSSHMQKGIMEAFVTVGW